MHISIIVAWLVLILSWILPPFIKDVSKKRLVGLSLSALATGIFIGILLTNIF